jgi:hypothetical protein
VFSPPGVWPLEEKGRGAGGAAPDQLSPGLWPVSSLCRLTASRSAWPAQSGRGTTATISGAIADSITTNGSARLGVGRAVPVP